MLIVKNIKILLVISLVSLSLAGFVVFRDIERVEGYTAYGNKFIVQDSAGREIFSIDDSGKMTDEGDNLNLCEQNSGSLPAAQKPGNWGNGFEIRNPDSNQIIAYIEDRGNGLGGIHLDGSINQNQGNLNYPQDSGYLIFQNEAGEIFAYIDYGGNLYLGGPIGQALCP